MLSLVPRLSTWRYPLPQIWRLQLSIDSRYATPVSIYRYRLLMPRLRQAADVRQQDRQTDGQTSDRYIDSTLHTMRAAPRTRPRKFRKFYEISLVFFVENFIPQGIDFQLPSMLENRAGPRLTAGAMCYFVAMYLEGSGSNWNKYCNNSHVEPGVLQLYARRYQRSRPQHDKHRLEQLFSFTEDSSFLGTDSMDSWPAFLSAHICSCSCLF